MCKTCGTTPSCPRSRKKNKRISKHITPRSMVCRHASGVFFEPIIAVMPTCILAGFLQKDLVCGKELTGDRFSRQAFVQIAYVGFAK